MKLALAALLTTLACGAPHWPGAPDLYGADLVLPDQSGWEYRQSTDWINDPVTRVHLKAAIEQVAAYYGHDPHEVDGLRIMLVRDSFDCSGEQAKGCMEYGDNTITLTILWDYLHPCIEGTAIAHELLHYFQGPDNEAGLHHEGPEWAELPALEQTLLREAEAEPGYCIWR